MATKRRALAISLMTASCASILTSCKSSAPSVAEAPIVPVAIVGPATLQNNVVLSAEFEPFQDVDVMAKVAGYVRDIRVDIGSHVKTGDVLAVLEVPEIQDELEKAKAGVAAAEANVVTARAGVQRAEAEANIAHLSFQRINEVATKNKGLVPRQDVDVAQSRDAEAVAQLASAKSALQAAQESKLAADSEYARAGAMMQYATIRAPFNGIVTKRYANTGSMIQAGISSQTQAMPVVRLAQYDVLRLTLPVPVTDAAEIKDGQSVDVNVANPSRTLRGKIARYAGSVQMDTRTMDTQVDVRNADGSLLPGMYAEVHLHLADHPHVMSVPIDAIDGLGTSVEQAYVVRDGVVHVVQVTTGLQTPTRLEVLSGLEAGDQVVVGRHTGLSEGEKVQPRPATYENGPSHS
ncbi:efflux RND transporter periplasmic adaptor subunit [Granulicella sp. 5B5]|uniref:efflux RND transporter periplasmic adaptor subunit n=1 Tax=Granulicella sp. 5B5 TaxID=1617967 RepID=UPI0015F6E2ED|nr:efflux RND transporter periplasmic adaptor subunit [Granulicella sp. 5B5]QMV18433.1 efflux RND transporter periplasmic adaptor subunit [Granulicella sp. 5B5]